MKNKAQLDLKQRTEELKLQHEKDMERFTIEAREEAERKVRDSGNVVQLENIKLHKDIELQKKELEYLKRAKTDLVETNKSIKQDQVLNEEGVFEYQQINLKQAQKIKKMKEKIEFLKNTLATEVAKYTKEIELQKIQSQERMTEFEKEILSNENADFRECDRTPRKSSSSNERS